MTSFPKGYAKPATSHQVSSPKTCSTCNTADETDKTPSRFSFKWLFRWERDSRPKSRPSSPDGKQKHILKSKTCDNTLSYLSMPKDSKLSYSSSFFQQLYIRTTAKPSSLNSREPSKHPDITKKIKPSFSSGDVPRFCHPSQGVPPPHSISISPSIHEGGLNPAAKDGSVMMAQPSWSIKKEPSDVSLPRKDGKFMANSVSSSEANFLQSPSSVLCRLCLGFVPSQDMYQLKECGCRFCKQCLQQYLTINIREGNVLLTCPELCCKKEGKIEVSEIEHLVENEIFDMFKRFKANREVELDPTRTWCPVPGCSTVCYVRPGATQNRGTPVLCPNCGFTFCSRCNVRWHATKTCDEFQKELRDEKEFPLCDDDNTPIKRCPFCRIPIERDEGCAQMMCKNCKHVFCWYCLASLDDDFLLRHYDKGPCKNKLGHSRASVVWHRTQVIGIFAGFGFLLLIASPILFLAAPCLLCCKCNKFIKEFEHEPPPE